jgi:hypothetical protein
MSVKNFFTMMHSSLKFYLNIFVFFLLSSCGAGFDFKEESTQVSYINEEYQAELKSNKNFSGFLKISIVDFQLSVRIKLFGPRSELKFLQVLHQRGICPQWQDFQSVEWNDLNSQMNYFGKVMLYLDSRINHQFESLGRFPKMRRNGSYYFSRAADLRSLYPAGLEVPLREMILMIYQYDSLDHDLVPVACGEIRPM